MNITTINKATDILLKQGYRNIWFKFEVDEWNRLVVRFYIGSDSYFQPSPPRPPSNPRNQGIVVEGWSDPLCWNIPF